MMGKLFISCHNKKIAIVSKIKAIPSNRRSSVARKALLIHRMGSSMGSGLVRDMLQKKIKIKLNKPVRLIGNLMII